MPPLCVPRPDPETAGAGRDRPGHPAPRVNLFAPPRWGCDPAGTGGLRRRLMERHAADFVAAHRPGMAALILVGHALGVAGEGEIDAAVADGDLGFHRLFRRTLDGLASHLDRIAAGVAGTADGGGFVKAQIELVSIGEGHYLSVETLFQYLDLGVAGLPRPLARLVKGALLLTTGLGFGLLAEDLIGTDTYLEEGLTAYRECREKHPGLSHLELAQLALREQIYPFSEQGSDLYFLVEWLDTLKSIQDRPPWLMGRTPGAGAMARLLARWGRTGHPLDGHPWTGFCRRVLAEWEAVPPLPDSEPEGRERLWDALESRGRHPFGLRADHRPGVRHLGGGSGSGTRGDADAERRDARPVAALDHGGRGLDRRPPDPPRGGAGAASAGRGH